MRTQPRDTSEAIERILIQGHQRFSPAIRFAQARRLTYLLAEANRQQAQEPSDPFERAVAFMQHLYGAAAAAALRAYVPRPSEMAFDLLATLERIAHLFADRQILFALTGSLACCLYGFPRTCRDVDVLLHRADAARIGTFPATFAVVSADAAPMPEFPMLGSWLDPQTLITVDLLTTTSRRDCDRLLARAL
jgi:hypothetical protein